MTYEQAVELARKKDDAGFRFLYESTYRDKYYIALKYMQNEDDALDVLQDAYIRAFDKLDTLDKAEKFPAWLGMIVANTAKNALVKKKPILFSEMGTETEDGDPFEFQIEDENIENQPELSYTKEETRELVQQMISSLSEEQRLCILMFYMEDMSIRDIAETLDCSENTVKSRLNYGRKNLKIKGEELQKKGYKLYGVAPLPLLLYLLRAEGTDFLSWTGIADLLTYQKVLEPSLAGGGHLNIGQPVSAGVNPARRAVQQFIRTTVGKVVIGTAAVVATAGVAAAVIHSQSSDNAEPVMQESIEMIVQGTEAAGKEENITPQSSEENIEETEPQASGEPTPELTVEPTPELTVESAPEPSATPEPEPTYTFTDMSATMYARQTVNVRTLPSTDGEKVGSLSTNQEITITGQCNETSWYRFEYNGETAYVSNTYLSDTLMEVAAPEPAQGETSTEPCPYPLNIWIKETTEYGLTIYVIYSTQSDIWSANDLAENNDFMKTGENGSSAFSNEMIDQEFNLEKSTGVGYGFHFVYPVVKVGTYAEGTIYKGSAGIHLYSSSPNGCPNFGTGLCQPGTID